MALYKPHALKRASGIYTCTACHKTWKSRPTSQCAAQSAPSPRSRQRLSCRQCAQAPAAAKTGLCPACAARQHEIAHAALNERRARDRAQAAARARQLLANPRLLIVDVETTGFSSEAEICQIAIVDADGDELFNTLVCPSRGIPEAATRIHGIDEDDVEDAPQFHAIAPRVRQLVAGSTLVAFNAAFERRMIGQECADWRIPPIAPHEWVCAMLLYTQYVADGSLKRPRYTRQRLPGCRHDALGDARATLNVLRLMAGMTPLRWAASPPQRASSWDEDPDGWEE